MKAEFELSLDTNGKPMIKFMHSDKSESLEQKILKVFIKTRYKYIVGFRG